MLNKFLTIALLAISLLWLLPGSNKQVAPQEADIQTILPAPTLQGASMGTIGPQGTCPAMYLQGACMGVIGPDPTTCQAVYLQGATMGVIPAADPTVVSGVNTEGTVRVNCLSNLEALLNIGANLGEIVGIFLSVVFVIRAVGSFCAPYEANSKAWRQLGIAAALCIAGLAFPGEVNWLVASARDLNFFS